MTSLLLGIDVGTASTKGVLLRPDGSSVADARSDHGMSSPRPGWAEQDADAIWWADVCAVARTLTGQVPPGDSIGAVAISAIGPTVLPLDERGTPLRPAILYGVDTRATRQIRSLERRHGKAALEAWSGMSLSSQAAGPKIRWIREVEPDVYARSRWFVTASTYLVFRMTGEMLIDPHTASHFNPLYDPIGSSWSDRFAADIVDPERLPRIAWPTELAGHVLPEAHLATGIPAGTPVAVGTVDALSEALSVGAVRPGSLMVMYGSTIFFIAVGARPRVVGDLWLTAGITPGTWAVAGGLATGGSALSWFRDTFAKDLVEDERRGGPSAFKRLSTEAGVEGPERPLVLPYFSGERTPINDPAARAVVLGLSLSSSRGNVYRGLLDGIAYACRANIDAIGSIGLDIECVTAVGGGTADRLLLQTVSDVTGLAQQIPADTIGASRGDAFVAGIASGQLRWADLDDWVSISRTIAPDPSTATRHATRYRDFGRVYRSTRGVVHRLSGDT